jgi:succinate dehydrogenase hydrophobic anchor subunit
MVDENSAAGKAGVNAKEDWFLTRVTARISALKKSFLMSMVLTDLANLNQKITGKTLKYKNSFQIVTALKLAALTKHTTTLKKSLPTFS